MLSLPVTGIGERRHQHVNHHVKMIQADVGQILCDHEAANLVKALDFMESPMLEQSQKVMGSETYFEINLPQGPEARFVGVDSLVRRVQHFAPLLFASPSCAHALMTLL